MNVKPTKKSAAKLEAKLKKLKHRVIIATIIAEIIAYSLLLLFIFAPKAHAEEASGRLDLNDITSAVECAAQSTLRLDILTWIPDANPGQEVTAIGDIEDGGSKQFTNVTNAYQKAHCIKLGNNSCGTDTFFSFGCDRNKTAFGISPINQVMMSILNWLAIGVSIVVLGGIIYGAIQYTTSGGDPARAKRAINIIRNAIIALVMYFAMWAVLNWLVPGGLFN